MSGAASKDSFDDNAAALGPDNAEPETSTVVMQLHHFEFRPIGSHLRRKHKQLNITHTICATRATELRGQSGRRKREIGWT